MPKTSSNPPSPRPKAASLAVPAPAFSPASSGSGGPPTGGRPGLPSRTPSALSRPLDPSPPAAPSPSSPSPSLSGAAAGGGGTGGPAEDDDPATGIEGPPDAPFSPLFTLVEDAQTRTTHHPAVHYLFADDAPDPDPLGDALLRAAATAAPAPPGDSRAGPDPDDGPPERVLLVTLDATGRRVTAAHSLAPDWQVLGAAVAPAPMLAGGERPPGAAGGHLLRIEGTAGWPASASSSRAAAAPRRTVDAAVGGESAGTGAEEAEADRLEGLVDEYRARMDELARVLARGVAAPEPEAGHGLSLTEAAPA